MIGLKGLKISAIDRFRQRLEEVFKGTLFTCAPMANYTTIQIGGPADLLAFPSDEEDLSSILRLAREMDIPYYVIGKGSNLLVSDGGIRGIVIDLSRGFYRMELMGEDGIWAEAGVALRKVVSKARDEGFAGLEFAVNIPGSVGGAIAMNAGAYGGEIGDLIDWIEVMTESGEKVGILREDLDFGYRNLDFGRPGIILRALLKFKKESTKDIEDKMGELIDKRKETQKITLPSAGSIFKNPPGMSAGKLIEELGLKGLKEGNAMISEIHGNYIVNLGGAECSDVLRLVDRIKDEAFSKRGIKLELEIKVAGEGLS